ncbi:hypothetical protein SAMN05216474_0742 [Lishizhenia tianjinensis]|uniref:Uncharacterized protein n=1 Tax=Lishizhenia tianjinensis TaxID=477690 RepID=A0A1I6Y9S3_9FLAO|nr:hypothetical protein [Lishizhenia tianjinensis]SFT47107.1 hypothetical protein SAMN05216474_0742 [Lishizhenia tianjinensis]
MHYFIFLAYLLGLMAMLAGVSSIAYGFYGMTVKKRSKTAVLFSLSFGFIMLALTFTLFKLFC